MQLRIDHQNKVPLHLQVEALMRKLIESPEFRNGAFLPKEVELANRLGVSRNTIRQATNKLEYEGLLVRKKGVGTTVAKKKPLSTGLDHWYSFTQEMRERGIQVENLQVRAEYVKADEKVSRFFNIRLHKTVLKLSKLKGSEGDPIVYFESYFHPRIALVPEDDFSRPLYTLLEEKFGVLVVRSNENISAALAGSLAATLQVSAQSPILVRERFVYDPGDRPIEYNLGYYRADKFTYSIDIKKAQL
ncbi:MAG TPA: GntR family transcriptional regulator [Puia sp.]